MPITFLLQMLALHGQGAKWHDAANERRHAIRGSKQADPGHWLAECVLSPEECDHLLVELTTIDSPAARPAPEEGHFRL